MLSFVGTPLPSYIVNAYNSIYGGVDEIRFADDFIFQADAEINSISWEGI